jgi:hypothetical protein
MATTIFANGPFSFQAFEPRPVLKQQDTQYEPVFTAIV